MFTLNSASAPCRRCGYFRFLTDTFFNELTNQPTVISKRAVRALATEVPAQAAAPSEASKSKAKVPINAAVILNRSPFLTKTPTPFERAYYAYQARIRRALHNPFPYDFYFKQGSLLETRFNMEERKRERKAFGPDFASEDYSSAESAEAMAAVEMLRQQESEGQEFAPRTNKADTEQDLTSLDRQGQRNLYLLLQEEEGSGRKRWRFPQGDVEKGELLHQVSLASLHLSPARRLTLCIGCSARFA